MTDQGTVVVSGLTDQVCEFMTKQFNEDRQSVHYGPADGDPDIAFMEDLAARYQAKLVIISNGRNDDPPTDDVDY